MSGLFAAPFFRKNSSLKLHSFSIYKALRLFFTRLIGRTLVQSKWDFSEAVLLLAEDPAQGSFRKFPEFLITGNCRTASGNGADGASDSKGSLFY